MNVYVNLLFESRMFMLFISRLVSIQYTRGEADYWADYNIIEPTESLEKAVKKLRKQQQ